MTYIATLLMVSIGTWQRDTGIIILSHNIKSYFPFTLDISGQYIRRIVISEPNTMVGEMSRAGKRALLTPTHIYIFSSSSTISRISSTSIIIQNDRMGCATRKLGTAKNVREGTQLSKQRRQQREIRRKKKCVRTSTI